MLMTEPFTDEDKQVYCNLVSVYTNKFEGMILKPEPPFFEKQNTQIFLITIFGFEKTL